MSYLGFSEIVVNPPDCGGFGFCRISTQFVKILYLRIPTMSTISFSGRHFERDTILQSVRWYLAYSLSYRDIEE